MVRRSVTVAFVAAVVLVIAGVVGFAAYRGDGEQERRRQGQSSLFAESATLAAARGTGFAGGFRIGLSEGEAGTGRSS